MELTVLGMNGPFPAANGATSGYLMRGEKTRVAMDMGSGTLGRLTALMPRRLQRLSRCTQRRQKSASFAA